MWVRCDAKSFLSKKNHEALIPAAKKKNPLELSTAKILTFILFILFFYDPRYMRHKGNLFPLSIFCTKF